MTQLRPLRQKLSRLVHSILLLRICFPFYFEHLYLHLRSSLKSDKYLMVVAGWRPRLPGGAGVALRGSVLDPLRRRARPPRRASSSRVGWDVPEDEGPRRTRDAPDATLGKSRSSRFKQSNNVAFTTDLCAWKIFGELNEARFLPLVFWLRLISFLHSWLPNSMFYVSLRFFDVLYSVFFL